MRLLLTFSTTLLLLLFPSSAAFAANLTLSASDNNITQDSEISINTFLSINTTDGTSYYLRGAFFKDGTADYCGYTWNGNKFFSGPYSINEGWKNFFPISVVNSSWSGILKVKLDPQDSGCKESGTYLFKIERFTNSGSAIFDNQNTLSFTATVPTAVPTLAPTARTEKITPYVPQTPTSVPQESSEITGSQILQLTPTQVTIDNDHVSTPEGTRDIKVLGISQKNNTQNKRLLKTVREIRDNAWMIYVLFAFGILSLACGILLFQKYKRKREVEEL